MNIRIPSQSDRYARNPRRFLLLAGLLLLVASRVSASLSPDTTVSVLDEKTKLAMQTFGRNALATAPGAIQSGTDLEKARYLCSELCKSFVAQNKKVSASNADRPTQDEMTDFTCGDLTERVKTVWVAAGIKAGAMIDVVADKDSWKPALLDPNLNHGAPALYCDGAVYILDLWEHAVHNNKEFTKFDSSTWNAMKPASWETQMRSQGYVRFSITGGYDYQPDVTSALASYLASRAKPRAAAGKMPLLGVFDGRISATYINEGLYLNQGMDPASGTRNENIIKRNRFMLENNLKPNITSPDKNKLKLQLMYFSDNENRYRAGDAPDVSFSVNGMLGGLAMGSGGYISAPDPQKRVKATTTSDSFTVVKTETTAEAGGSVHYVYTMTGTVNGDRVIGTWVTTYNGQPFLKGEFTADRTVRIGSKGNPESVK